LKISVFKFGGASVKDAEAVRNLEGILKNFNETKLIIVVSAMGKTTNALEKVVEKLYRGSFPEEEIKHVEAFHLEIVQGLFLSDFQKEALEEVKSITLQIREICKSTDFSNHDADYDQIVGLGEVLSTKLIFIYLKSLHYKVSWADARQLVLTDSLYREASVDWSTSSEKIKTHCLNDLKTNQWIITQGFIGADSNGSTTTLGREGSDFTGAIFAWALDAENLTIWKDVPGLLNADPKIFNNTTKLDTVSYGETIELAYYGATIIHPKTIKPLQNKQIPLYVKSFLNPQSEGSCIAADTFNDQDVPNFIVKKNQLLMSISPRDYSFMNEDHLAKIFSLLAKLHIKVNMMQVSALSFSICIDDNERKNNQLTENLRKDYKVKYNKELELLTIRHYRQKDVSECSKGRKILLEQRSRSTIQMVLTLTDK